MAYNLKEVVAKKPSRFTEGFFATTSFKLYAI